MYMHHMLTQHMHTPSSIKGKCEVPLLVLWSELIVRNLVRQEGVHDGTEGQTIRPTGAEILNVHILKRESV